MAKGKPKHRRQLRNYLLDAHFQLKYAAYLGGVALVLSLGLGFLLYDTSVTLIEQSKETVDLGLQVTEESRKVSAVVEMNIAEQYADTPELLAVFEADNKKQADKLNAQQEALQAQSAAMQKQQTTLLTILFSALSVLVIVLFLAGIVITHKVAGPIFKMKGQINKLAGGDWALPYPLRKGDELIDFFEAFRSMVKELRKNQEQEIALLDSAIDLVEAGDDEGVAKLRELRASMASVLEEEGAVSLRKGASG